MHAQTQPHPSLSKQSVTLKSELVFPAYSAIDTLQMSIIRNDAVHEQGSQYPPEMEPECWASNRMKDSS